MAGEAASDRVPTQEVLWGILMPLQMPLKLSPLIISHATLSSSHAH